MKDYRNIHDLESLEKEIQVLELESKLIRERMDRNFTHLKSNFLSMTLKSFLFKGPKAKEKVDGCWKNILANELISGAINTISTATAEKAANVFSKITEKFSHSK